ncbi:ornithine carbamoyltransferase [Paludisphaera rhizosphaerae]|uniref:ornithine carbamoyltransferase n=1 Tax=Paludisphaera rhizosphaerae TaxID=2711216 RepID=UPI0013EB6B05|nr:ornithine carbamoyltransferase [Paludisphaera rhizosphaerae]
MNRRNGAAPSADGSPRLQHFLDLRGLDPESARRLLDRASELKDGRLGPGWTPPLQGRSLGLVFEKPSLRTRVSFETAFTRLGGNSIFLRGKDVGMGVRESVADFARVISQYVDALAVRTFAHSTLEELAEYATIPVVNALSDDAHPCQAMADMLTLLELKGKLEGVRLAFIGDGNNVAMSLAEAAALLGVEFVLACPENYKYPDSFRSVYSKRFPDVPLLVTHDPREAAEGADALYSDVWASMGQESEADQRREIFAPFQVDEELMAAAHPDAVFLHCLPAHRGEEVTSGVLDGPQSHVFQQAANRMYFQMALLEWLVQDRSAQDRLNF